MIVLLPLVGGICRVWQNGPSSFVLGFLGKISAGRIRISGVGILPVDFIYRLANNVNVL